MELFNETKSAMLAPKHCPSTVACGVAELHFSSLVETGGKADYVTLSGVH
jgi:hypothetical protein